MPSGNRPKAPPTPGSRGFFLDFERPNEPQCKFPTDAAHPFPPAVTAKLANSLTTDEVFKTSLVGEDADERRRKKWKLIRQLWSIFRQPPYNRGSIENALWFYGNRGVTVHHFVMAIVSEFKFAQRLNVDNYLRWLYWSFEGGSQDGVDWRDMLVAFKIVILFRMVKTRALDLLIILFDIYAVPGAKGDLGHPDDDWYLPKANKYLAKIFHSVCETEDDIKSIDEHIATCVHDLKHCEALGISGHSKKKSNEESKFDFGSLSQYGSRLSYEGSLIDDEHVSMTTAASATNKKDHMTRRAFKNMLKLPSGEELVNLFKKFAWQRLPSELRLQALDEAQTQGLKKADAVLMRFKLEQALYMHVISVYRSCFKHWYKKVQEETKVTKYLQKQLFKSYGKSFKFWRLLASHKKLKRQRRLLGEVMGVYSVKARCFARMKLYIYQVKRVMATVGPFNPHVKDFRQGGMHIRQYRRISKLREYYHRWWNECVKMNNWELAECHDYERICRPIFKAWGSYATWEARQKRFELVVLERQEDFNKRMAATDQLVAEMIQMEKEKIEKQKLEEAEQRVIEKKNRLENAKIRAQKDRMDDQRLIKSVQREARRVRIFKQMKKMKKEFNKAWVKRREEMLRKSAVRVREYLAVPENKVAIIMKFEKLKKEFYAPPARENMEREKRLSNPKNIVFLYLEAMLTKHNMDLKRVIPKFSKETPGVLTYDEFAGMVRTLGINMNPVQINDCIKGVDTDGDGFIEFKELQASFKDVMYMGVPGSKWKMYIDPVQDIICYHNFETGEKVMEYQMTDQKLMEISEANYYGEAWWEANEMAKEMKNEDWDNKFKDYMVRRMQYMYRLWKSRRKREKVIWRIKNRESSLKQEKFIKCIHMIETALDARKSRERFKLQLHLTYEKVWDISCDPARMFYYNHQTKQSTWDRPALLWRYGDVPVPPKWIPCKPTEQKEGDPPPTTQHYWHVIAKKDIPRKPDGLPLCEECELNLALQFCEQCERNYCFPCKRKIHCHPLGFSQLRPKPKDLMDPTYHIRVANFTHTYKPVKRHLCQLCRSDKLLAGIKCVECNQELCRPCSRRLHSDGCDKEFLTHTLYNI